MGWNVYVMLAVVFVCWSAAWLPVVLVVGRAVRRRTRPAPEPALVAPVLAS